MRNNLKIKDSSKKILSKGEIVIYRAKDGKAKLEARLEEETVWLNQSQISLLFNTERSVITKHLRNIFKSGELDEKSNVQKMHIPNSDKPVKFYNLDAIISIGYRVNSKRATEFRIWATYVLKKYIIKGVAINQKRLKDKSIDFYSLEQAIKLLQSTMESKKLKADEVKGLLKVITEYANSWLLLNKYDQGEIKIKKTKVKRVKIIDYDFAKELIELMKHNLVNKKQASQLFGQERSHGLESILNSINQSFAGKEIYPSIEEKATHLLYFVIKNHPFVDGNKRIASILFIFFLSQNNFLLDKKYQKKINDSAIVALALLVAQSKPKDKDVMIALITNLVKK